MKNIQEILLKCGGAGKLVLGDEEINISVTEVKSKVQHLDGCRNAFGEIEAGDNIIYTNLEILLCENDFCFANVEE